MNRTIRHITEQFVSKLPDGKEYYRIEDLKEYGFPAFLIQRIHIELQWNLDESMILPKTDWADTQSETVQQSWQQFLNAIHAEVHLPKPYARAVIETAVADIIEMLVQPRKNIPDILFGGEDKLSAEEVDERTELLVVYPHFARVLTRYMNRRKKEQLDRQQCKKIIRQVDEKITAQYTPLQWAQMLDPLFALAGPDIDTDLLRLFFEDREMSRAARKFDRMSGEINRASFIEVLSSPELLNYDGYEEDQSELFVDKQPEQAEAGPDQREETEEEIKEQEAAMTAEMEEEEPEPLAEIGIEVEEDVAEVNQDKEEEQQLIQSMHEEQEKENEPEPIVEQHLQEEEHDDEKEPEEETSSLNAFFSERTTPDETHEYEEEPAAVDDEVGVDTLRAQADEEEGEEEKAAIWMRFMQSEELKEEQQEDTTEGWDDEQEADQPEDEYSDEPIIDLTENDEQQAEELKQLLRDDKSYFVEELFNGSERAYEESLQEIAEKDTWKKASKLIEKNIFKRNMINIYSEAAVDFTDRLQTYFLDKQNRN